MEHINKPVIGLCGGIGAGKSTVAAAFEALGCLVIDSDRLSHEMINTPQVQRQLAAWWGPEVIRADGWTDRQRVGQIVFGDPQERKRLESLLHPLIAERRAAIISVGNTNPAVKAIILDSPLLLESNLDRLCDKIVFVDASEALRVQRLQRARDWDLEQLRKRERWQLPSVEKRQRADYVISNEGSPRELQQQVAGTLADILQAR